MSSLASVATIINDCRDPDAMMRQSVRITSLLGCGVVPTPVRTDFEASHELVNALDAAKGDERAVVFANVAPRNGHSRKWGNGTPFVYFEVENTLVLASVEGNTLSLAKKLGLLPNPLQLLEVKEVMLSLISQGKVEREEGEAIIHSQFRSFTFLPLAASFILSGENLPTTEYDAELIPEAEAWVVYKDNFGNCKTSLLPEDVEFTEGKVVRTRFGEFPCIPHLADVPDGETALTIGSSGYGEKRLLEIVINGDFAAKRLGIRIGAHIL